MIAQMRERSCPESHVRWPALLIGADLETNDGMRHVLLVSNGFRRHHAGVYLRDESARGEIDGARPPRRRRPRDPWTAAKDRAVERFRGAAFRLAVDPR